MRFVVRSGFIFLLRTRVPIPDESASRPVVPENPNPLHFLNFSAAGLDLRALRILIAGAVERDETGPGVSEPNGFKCSNRKNPTAMSFQEGQASGPGFEPAARLLKRFLIRRCVSLLSRENSLFGKNNSLFYRLGKLSKIASNISVL